MTSVWFEHCKVIREPGKTYLINKETQKTVFSIPGGWYPDDQIRSILRIYNAGLQAGIAKGRAQKQNEIKKDLGLLGNVKG